ncbi:MAG: hypothetical protein GX802_02455 [Clostridiales bacterium]|nr:hypothetical protein [Clostridiales bacterium]
MLNIELFLTTLAIMWQGMLGIFIVTGIIMLSVVLMNRLNNNANGDE